MLFVSLSPPFFGCQWKYSKVQAGRENQVAKNDILLDDEELKTLTTTNPPNTENFSSAIGSWALHLALQY